jgi:hypothetical protein
LLDRLPDVHLHPTASEPVIKGVPVTGEPAG